MSPYTKFRCRWRTNHNCKSFLFVFVGCVLVGELIFLYQNLTSTPQNKGVFLQSGNTSSLVELEMNTGKLLSVWEVTEPHKFYQDQRPEDGTPAPGRPVSERTDGVENASLKPGLGHNTLVTGLGHNTWLELIRKATEKRFGRPPSPGSLIFNASSAVRSMPQTAGIGKLKKILLWNDFYFDKDYNFGYGQEPFLTAGCPVSTCYTTADRERFKPHQLDAVVWHQRSHDQSFPAFRHPRTRFVYFMVESPQYKFTDLAHFAGIFNYTMTFRTDSDIYQPYGIFTKRLSPRNELKNKNFAKGKSRMAVWFSSHCGTASRREKLILTLGDFISIDIYGGCGNKMACPLNGSQHNTESCYKKAAKRYKFYLAFENSLCVDYVTEKFFGPARYDIIPVVYGLASYEAIAPPHSYINVLDFKSVRHLVDYLHYLDKNDTAYNEYFRWKVDYDALMQYKSSTPPEYQELSWCQLCHKLHTDHTPKVYTYLSEWRRNDSCVKASSKLIQKFLDGEEVPTLFR